MTNPTTPTPEQLREDAAHLRRVRASVLARVPVVPMTDEQRTRAALALEEQAARLEAPAAELRGWGVMRDDQVLARFLDFEDGEMARAEAESMDELDQHHDYRAVPVRLTTEGATAREGESK